MVDETEDYDSDSKDLKEIAELFKNEVNLTYRLVEELYTSKQDEKGLEEKDSQKFFEMALVYLMRYLEIFNREFFIKLLTLRPRIMMKTQKSTTDQKKLLISYEVSKKDRKKNKLLISYKEILEYLIHGDPDEFIPSLMAKKIYNEIFSYEKMGFEIFIKKLLDQHLDLDFTNESKNRNLEFGISLQNYKEYRNKIVHGKHRLSLKEKEFSVMELETLIIEYIRLVEELVYPKYFKKRLRESELKDWN